MPMADYHRHVEIAAVIQPYKLFILEDLHFLGRKV